MSVTNITIKIDAIVARDAKVLAAKRGTSLSRMVAEQLAELVREDQVYAAARRNALRSLKDGFEMDWEKPETRKDLHDRESLR